MAFEKIISVKNEGIKDVLSLRERKRRDADGLTLIDGIREFEAALDAGVVIEKVYLCPELIERKGASTLEAKISKHKIQILETSRVVFEKISFGDRVEGIVAVARPPRRALQDLKLGRNPLLVIVESVEKPGNLGAILRTCDAAGVDGLIVCDGRTDVYNPNAIRASLGAVFTVPVVACENQQALDFLRSRQIMVIGTFPDSRKSYLKADYSVPTAILLGSEQEGLSPFWQKNADDHVQITMSGKVNSLNVSISAAIMIYEAVRQRKV